MAILDGGLPRWLAEGFETDGIAESEMRTLKVRGRASHTYSSNAFKSKASAQYPLPEFKSSFIRDYHFMVENSKFETSSTRNAWSSYRLKRNVHQEDQ